MLRIKMPRIKLNPRLLVRAGFEVAAVVLKALWLVFMFLTLAAVCSQLLHCEPVRSPDYRPMGEKFIQTRYKIRCYSGDRLIAEGLADDWGRCEADAYQFFEGERVVRVCGACVISWKRFRAVK